MSLVNLKIAKSLKRKGFHQGLSKYYYQKRPNCSVYDLVEDQGKYRDKATTYDAPDEKIAEAFLDNLKNVRK